jgi:PAS domain S-box-containing protein
MARDIKPADNPSPSSLAFQDVLESSRVITETASDAIITIDETSRILFANRGAENIFGYTAAEMLAGELTMLMPEYYRHLHRAGLKNYLEHGQKHISWEAVELPGLHKSGKEIALELSFAEFQKNGRRFFTGIARDITRRKETEQRLSALQKITDSTLAHLTLEELLPETLNRIREVLHVDTVAILLLRKEGDELIAWAAKGLEEEVELGVRIPVGEGFAGRIVAQCKPMIIDDVTTADIFNPLLREKGLKSLLGVPLLAEGRPIGVLHVGTLKSTRFTEADQDLLQLAADRITLAIENARLYEVEKTARAHAENANRSKDEFLTILSHELRTPLTPIIGWVHMMEQGILPVSEYDKALAVINRNANGLKRLINDLLDMSAIINGKMRFEESMLSLSDVLAEAVETMRPYASESGVEIKFRPLTSDSEFTIKGDRTRLNQSFCNILHNAIKFSQPYGVIRVNWRAEETEATITISDDGQGISKDFLPYIFERFRQADSSRTRSYGGLGLGLALAKNFITAQGGAISATSEGKGKGSTFVITLPRAMSAEADAESARQLVDDEKKSVGLRVLIVEDEPDTLYLLSEHFKRMGYEPVPFGSAAEALEIATREHFDLLVSDLAMPEIDGLELIRKLRTMGANREIPAIALTGYASAKDAAAALGAGFNLHLAKPFDPLELTEIIRDLLNDKEKQGQ